MSPTPRVLVIGAGIGGIATAHALTARGLGPVLVLEAEPSAGTQATAQNAAMLHQVDPDPVVSSLARHTRLTLEAQPEGLGRHFTRTGSLQLMSGPVGERWIRVAGQHAHALGQPFELWGRGEAVARHPWLEQVRFERALFVPDDGVIDVAGLAADTLAEARAGGAVVRYGVRVEGLRLDDAGRVVGVESTAGPISAELVVVAAGAWNPRLFAEQGMALPDFAPYRRHLYFLRGELMPAGAPWIWHRDQHWYVRPEAGGLLVSACDREAWPVHAEPSWPPVDPADAERLGTTLELGVPVLGDFQMGRVWAGLRTMGPGERFFIEPDPRRAGLLWVAGLGGHGVSTSLGVGARAADQTARMLVS